MPSNGSSSSPPFTTAGMSVTVYGPMVSLWIVICAFCIRPFAVYVGRSKFSGPTRSRSAVSFESDDVARACIDHEFEGDAVSAAFDVVVAVGIRFDPNDVVGTLGRARFVTGLQNRSKEGNEAEQPGGQRRSIGCPAEQCPAEAETGHRRDARPKRRPSLFLCFPDKHIRGHGVLLGPSA